MFTVSATAATRQLTSLAAVKADIGSTSNSEDAYLLKQIDVSSALVCTYLDVAVANDGTRTLGRETLVETFRFNEHGFGAPMHFACAHPQNHEIILARVPVVSVSSVVEEDITLDQSQYEFDGPRGLLRRLDDCGPREWWARKIVVTYVAGWLLPNDAGRNLPFEIEDAAIKLIKAERFTRARDPLLKADEIAGVGRQEFWVGAPGASISMPANIAAQIDQYRNMRAA